MSAGWRDPWRVRASRRRGSRADAGFRGRHIRRTTRDCLPLDGAPAQRLRGYRLGAGKGTSFSRRNRARSANHGADRTDPAGGGELPSEFHVPHQESQHRRGLDKESVSATLHSASYGRAMKGALRSAKREGGLYQPGRCQSSAMRATKEADLAEGASVESIRGHAKEGSGHCR
jgi:hypothetical protein